jgi:predicted Na+-dependent transporter
VDLLVLMLTTLKEKSLVMTMVCLGWSALLIGLKLAEVKFNFQFRKPRLVALLICALCFISLVVTLL